MKTYSVYIYFSILLVFSFLSCGDTLETECKEETDFYEEPLTRALSIDEPSISNPDLHDNWENTEVLYLNGGGFVDAPWVFKEGNSINIPLNYRMDIKKEDGWVMLSHTLINQQSSEPNYILLYNKYRGIMKGFYYNKTPQKNQGFLWVLEAQRATALFPSNIHTEDNSTNQYLTTSNIVETSAYDFGHLNSGWNAFSFEFIYSTDNPVISIKGYNDETSRLQLNGDYSGEVIIPIPKEDESGLSSLVSSLKKVAGVIPALNSLETALSVAGTVLGSTSLGKTTSTTTIRATSSGKINLTGSSFTSFGGIVGSINNIDIKRLNGNTNMGLWKLKKMPEYEFDVYNRATVTTGTGRYTSLINIREKEQIYNSIEINPVLLNSIESYRIISAKLFTTSTGPYQYTPINNNTYYLIAQIEGRTDYVPMPGESRIAFFTQTNSFRHLPLYVNVLVEFKYKDGSKFLSSRNFQVNMTPNNNKYLLDNLTANGNRYMIVN